MRFIPAISFLLITAVSKGLLRGRKTKSVEEIAEADTSLKNEITGAPSTSSKVALSSLGTFIISKDNDKFLAALSFFITVAALTVGLSNKFLAGPLSFLALLQTFLIGIELYKRLPSVNPGASKRERLGFLFSNTLTWFKYSLIAVIFILSLYVILQYRDLLLPSIKYHRLIGNDSEYKWLEFINITMLAMWLVFLFFVVVYDLFDTIFRFRHWMKGHRRIQIVMAPLITLALFILAYSVALKIDPWVYRVTPKLTGNIRLYEQNERERLRQEVDLSVLKMEVFTEAEHTYIKVVLLAKNNSDKDIKALKGTMVFRDVFRDKLKQIPIKQVMIIRAHESMPLTVKLSIDQSSEEDKRLSESELEEIRSVWLPDHIIYTDKTVSVADIASIQ